MRRESATSIGSRGWGFSLLLLLLLGLPSCRTPQQTVQKERATELIAQQDSVGQLQRKRQQLTVQWWGDEPPKVVREPSAQLLEVAPERVLPTEIQAPHKRGGYTIELQSEEQSDSVSRDTQAQTSSTSSLAQEKSGRHLNLFYLGLALGLTCSLLHIIYRVWRKMRTSII